MKIVCKPNDNPAFSGEVIRREGMMALVNWEEHHKTVPAWVQSGKPYMGMKSELVKVPERQSWVNLSDPMFEAEKDIYDLAREVVEDWDNKAVLAGRSVELWAGEKRRIILHYRSKEAVLDLIYINQDTVRNLFARLGSEFTPSGSKAVWKIEMTRLDYEGWVKQIKEKK